MGSASVGPFSLRDRGQESAAFTFIKPDKKSDQRLKDVRRSLSKAETPEEALRLYELLLDGDVADLNDHLRFAYRALWLCDVEPARIVLEDVLSFVPTCGRAWRLLRWLGYKINDRRLILRCESALAQIRAGLVPFVAPKKEAQ